MNNQLLNSKTDRNIYNSDNNYDVSARSIHNSNIYSNNLYPLVGKQHNDGLDYFIQHYSNSRNADEINRIVLQYTNSLGYRNLSMPNNTLNLIEMYSLNNYLIKMQKISDNISSIDSIQNLLSDLQNTISQDSSISSYGKSALLCAIDVASNSANYWYMQANLGSQSLWVNSNNPTPDLMRAFWHKFWASDMVGAFFGFVGSAGNPLGLIAGGVGGSIAYWVGA